MCPASFQRMTRQREVIIEELRKLRSHPTAVELHDLVRRRLPRISLGTVYRNLELLAQVGEIRKIDLAGDQARFDGNVARHHHVRCVRCGRIGDIIDPPLDLSAMKHDDCGGYQLHDYQIQFVGLCPDCRREPISPTPTLTEAPPC